MLTTGSLKDAASIIPEEEFPNHRRDMAHKAEIALRPKIDGNLAELCISFGELMDEFDDRMALRIHVRVSEYYRAVHLS